MLKSKSEVLSQARLVGLSRVLDQFEGLMLNSVRLYSRAAGEAELPLGSSRIGGKPDLPPGVSWPTWKTGPMSFIAQIRLSEVKEHDIDGLLPARGTLYFFYDCEQGLSGFEASDGEDCRVFHYAGPERTLVRTGFPADLPERDRFLPCTLRPAAEVTLAPEDFLIEGLDLTPVELKAYYSLLEEVQVPSGPSVSHRLLGHPDQIQTDMQPECELASQGRPYSAPNSKTPGLLAKARNWRLLFQVDTDDDAHMMWGDVGRVYFWLRLEDLMQGRFQNVRPITQCT